ncbi:MAG: tRNA (N6-threonylcarbamoyladenosine(37)-N6)-methyltransferase TrmO [Clostridia bacterium]|nr:tRNA (N6-threonylcarbamoyladenosine(37)-N6)-methyltransferase TrmO [Clostridia bacterium]
MKIIAHIHNGFETKFGVPRQGGIVNEVKSKIVFEKEYRVPEAFRGLESFSHIWVLWKFDEAERDEFSPTVRPPRLGGNKRVGVFATRSPFRPNPIGLSVLKIEKLELDTPDGPVLTVLGADMKNGTPIYDIKPYLPEFDSIPEASEGFAEKTRNHKIDVIFPDEIATGLLEKDVETIKAILSHDPKPSYIHNERVYGMAFDGKEIKFTYTDDGITVLEVTSR